MDVSAPGDGTPATIDLTLLESERVDPGSRAISDVELAVMITALVRLYAARVEASGAFPALITKEATATDALLCACEMVGFHDINMFDFTMWYDRRRSR